MASQVNLDYQTIWTPCRVGIRLSSQSSTSQRRPVSPYPEHAYLSKVEDAPAEEAPSTSQALASGNEGLIYISDDAASDIDEASCDRPLDETLPSIKAIVQSLPEETGATDSTDEDREQRSNCEDEHEATHRSAAPPPEDKQVNESPRSSFSEPAASQLTGASSLTPSAHAATPTSTPSTSRTNSPSPQPRSWDAISTQTSCTSMSATDGGATKTDIRTPTHTYSLDKPESDSPTPGSICEKSIPNKPLMRHSRRRPRSRTISEASHGHYTEQSSAVDVVRVSDDAEYCLSTDHETEGDSDDQFSDVERLSRKRRKRGTVSRITRSPSEGSAHSASAHCERAAGLASPATSERADNLTESTEAAFDEWVLQDVVLKRTIMNGKATFQFQFDWDLCTEHGVGRTSIRRKAKSRQGNSLDTTVAGAGTARRMFTRDEDRWLVELKERQELPWVDIHRRFCRRFTERSKESLQVRYCTKLKQRDAD
ncbi:hypothetical protein K4F52_009399 [Lecanicillium sp. MT-2017a]|nr:hypothetical protein K4F52_009399 [Lecanicillium sp. MT-2017a]